MDFPKHIRGNICFRKGKRLYLSLPLHAVRTDNKCLPALLYVLPIPVTLHRIHRSYKNLPLQDADAARIAVNHFRVYYRSPDSGYHGRGADG